MTLPTFVGEWSASGAAAHPTVSYSRCRSLAWKQGSWLAEQEAYPTSAQQAFMAQWFLAQADAWENTNHGVGWFFWYDSSQP